jgi:hypothetical protein
MEKAQVALILVVLCASSSLAAQETECDACLCKQGRDGNLDEADKQHYQNCVTNNGCDKWNKSTTPAMSCEGKPRKM